MTELALTEPDCSWKCSPHLQAHCGKVCPHAINRCVLNFQTLSSEEGANRFRLALWNSNMDHTQEDLHQLVFQPYWLGGSYQFLSKGSWGPCIQFILHLLPLIRAMKINYSHLNPDLKAFPDKCCIESFVLVAGTKSEWYLILWKYLPRLRTKQYISAVFLFLFQFIFMSERDLVGVLRLKTIRGSVWRRNIWDFTFPDHVPIYALLWASF